ncbi:MAG: hypothetical protein Q7S72_00135 [Candidatus Taylorbacteria bacterium]|nr:hypothetical protein [Candidatus Taylorbacteria bacterium]
MATKEQYKTERNDQVVADHESNKFTTSQLVAKYDISTARIYQIINRYKKNKLV